MNTRPTWRRPIQRPWISAVLLALLAADAWWVLRDPTYHAESRAAVAFMNLQRRIVKRLGGQNARVSYEMSSLIHEFGIQGRGRFLIREPDRVEGQLRLVHQDEVSWDELSRLRAEFPHRVAGLKASFGTRRIGLWALTREHLTDAVTLEPWEPGSFDDVAAHEIRTLLTARDWHGAPSGPADQSTTRILPWGYAHNTAALLALAAFIISLGWVPRVPAAYRARRGKRRLARGYCPRCRYNLAGLEASRCPECGEQWGEGEQAAGLP